MKISVLQNRYRIFGATGLILLFILNLFYLISDKSSYLLFLENNFSFDKNISKPLLHIAGVQIFFVLSIIGTWVCCNGELYKNFRNIDLIAGISIVLLSFTYHLRYVFHPLHPFYTEDGFFECMTSGFFLVSSVILFFTASRYSEKRAKLVLWCVSGTLFFLGMEEISWGQRIFDWETPLGWKAINYQKETNFHNLFNPVFKWIYPIFNLFAAILMYSVVRIKQFMPGVLDKPPFSDSALSNESLFYTYVFVFLFFQSAILGGELTEEIVSILALLFAVKCLLHKGNR